MPEASRPLDPWSRDISVAPPALRCVAHAVFLDGSRPGYEFLQRLAAAEHTTRVAARFLDVLTHLTRNWTHRYFKSWEGDAMQVTVGDFRLIAARYHARGIAHLTTLYGFEKHRRKTPRNHENEIRTLYERFRKERGLGH